ncbi:MAG: DUF4173 domain-containing protein [Lachnospiraceae bacterium]|nr:DUF4173 domain-containing protein [Lachnospiraceae bacterium]
MENNNMNIVQPVDVPENVPAGFQTGIVEKIISVLIWPVCFLYSSMFFEDDKTWNIMFGVFVLLFIAMGEAIYWNRKRTPESWAMLIMTIAGGVGTCFSLSNVWESWMVAFFTHLFAVYWILCRSGRLAEGKTSHMLVWDGITGFCVMPFKNWPLDVRTIISIFKFKGDSKKKKTVPIVILAATVGIILFFIAMAYLRSADDTFDNIMYRIGDFLKIDIDIELIPKLFMTAYFSCYLYGLIGGCYRETEPQVQHRGDNVKWFVGKLRRVPGLVWVIFVGLFSVFYIMFFAIQGSYVFNAFIMKLPAEFTYSEYARRGFGEMCGVMAVNFILIWLSTRTSETKQIAVKVSCIILNIESMLFGLIGLLKVLMYINAYGFTPLRLQSFLASGVMLLGCICAMVSMIAKKKTIHIWFFAGAASIAVLCLV